MVLQFRLTNGNFKRNISFEENNTIGDIVNYLESNYTKTTQIESDYSEEKHFLLMKAKN